MLKYKIDILSIGWVFAAFSSMCYATINFASFGLPESVFFLLLNSYLSFMSGVVNHNHGHNSLFKNKRINRITDFFLSLLMGASSRQIIFTHILNHHKHSSTPKDWTYPGQVKSTTPILILVEDIYRSTTNIYRNRESALADHPQIRKKVSHERRFLQVFSICALLSFPIQFLLFWVIPWALGLMGMLTVNFIQHFKTTPGQKAVDFMSPLENFVFLNNGLHSPHHTNMTTHWSHLRKMHDPTVAQMEGSLVVYLLLF